MGYRRVRTVSAIAALCIIFPLTVSLTGCDKIDQLRNFASGGSRRHGHERKAESEAFPEGPGQSLNQVQGMPAQDASRTASQLANDISARSIVFVPDAGEQVSGVLKATFDNTFRIPADVAVVISVDGVVVANGATRVPPESRWTYSAPYTFNSPGDHALRMGAYLKSGMPMPESDIANNEAAGIGSVSPDAITRYLASAGNAAKKEAVPTVAPDQGIDLNDIEARSIGFMPDGAGKYTSQTFTGQPGVIRTTFSNGFNYDANLRVNILDGESVLSDVILAVPRRSQGAYFVKYSFDAPGMHKITLRVYQMNAQYPERNPINNEMTTVISVTAPPESAVLNKKETPADIEAKKISFQAEGNGSASDAAEAGGLGRIKLDYSSTFTAKTDLVISWIIDGNVIAETPVKSVPPGESYSLMGYTFDAPGKHTIGAEIKPVTDGKVEETDVRNNKVETSVEVVPAKDIAQEAADPQVIGAHIAGQPHSLSAGFSMVEPLGQQSQELPQQPAASQTPQDAVAAPSPVAVPTSASYDLVADSIAFLAAPGNEPVDSATAGQGGAISYTVRNKSGAVKAVAVRIRLELEGRSKFSLVKKIDIPDGGVYEGVTGNLVLSQPGSYTLSLSADNPDNSAASRTGRYFELTRTLNVLPRIAK